MTWEEIKPVADETFGCDSSKITLLDLWYIARKRGMKPHEVVRAIEREAEHQGYSYSQRNSRNPTR